MTTDASFESFASVAFLDGARILHSNSPNVPEIVGSAVIKLTFCAASKSSASLVAGLSSGKPETIAVETDLVPIAPLIPPT